MNFRQCLQMTTPSQCIDDDDCFNLLWPISNGHQHCLGPRCSHDSRSLSPWYTPNASIVLISRPICAARSCAQSGTIKIQLIRTLSPAMSRNRAIGRYSEGWWRYSQCLGCQSCTKNTCIRYPGQHASSRNHGSPIQHWHADLREIFRCSKFSLRHSEAR